MEDFLANAAGLADALAALHGEGIVHGAIDTSCLFHAVSHSAKLGGVGRAPVGATAREDVCALAAAMEEGLTGRKPGGPPPSEMIDGLSPVVDGVLSRARLGLLTARQLALNDAYGNLKAWLEAEAVVRADGSRWIANRPTHRELAFRIGRSREMVSRLLKDLESGGYVVADGKGWQLAKVLPERW